MNKAQANAFVASLNRLCKEHGFTIGFDDDSMFIETPINADDNFKIDDNAFKDEKAEPEQVVIYRKWWKF